jgi:hypothetical protein
LSFFFEKRPMVQVWVVELVEGDWEEIRVVYASALGVGAVKADRLGSTKGIVGVPYRLAESRFRVLSDCTCKLEQV